MGKLTTLLLGSQLGSGGSGPTGKFKPKYLSFAYQYVEDLEDFHNYLKTLDTSEIINFFSCFRYLTRSGTLSRIDGLKPEIDTSNAENMERMFANIEKLLNIDLSNFNFEKCTSLSYMFDNDSYFTNFIGPSVPQKVYSLTNLSCMFNGCTRYNGGIDLNFLDNRDNEKIKLGNFYGMFNNCQTLTFVKMKNIEFKNSASGASFSAGSMFYNCYTLERIDLDNIDLTGVSAQRYCFNNCGYYLPSGTYTKVYVKNEASRDVILNNLSGWGAPSGWSTANVIVAGSEDDHRND